MTVLRDYASGLSQPTLAGGPARYDEVVGPDGSLRPAWRSLAERAVALSPADLRRVDGDILLALADDGVTYAPPGEAAGPWRLDPMPLVLDAPTWTPLETGLAQRAELLNAILVDLYGEQRLLSEAIVPPAVVLGHSGFTRAMARPGAIDPRPLVLSATDLGRGADGEWRVVADRAQAPSGMGYAMENRRVISRVLPELYRDAALHRMEPYFWALRSALMQSADGDRADPRVVVLSPGTLSETAYDQAFLASTLGFPLVQGSDLVVRDGWVWMRSPGPAQGGNLDRVDVILRRVDAAWSDPLELRGDSRLGVAGLVEAVRRGRVRVVNSIGSGVLENPGLLPYMPAMCEALLGETLRLPAVDTWWCGDPASLDHVIHHLGDLDVRRIDQEEADSTPPSVSRTGVLRVLREQVLAEPHRYVGQARLPLSQAPTWGGEGRTRGVAVAKSVILRSFTLRYGSAYRPLVGGLASVVDVGDPSRRSLASKDVWVLKGDPDDADQGLIDVLPMTSAASVSIVVPRILEDMFWFGRYAERTEDLLRLVLAVQPVAEDWRSRPGASGAAALDVLMAVTARLAGRRHTAAGVVVDSVSGAGVPGSDVDAELRSLLLDVSRSGSAAHALAGLRTALQGVRDQLSHDTWRAFGATDRGMAALRISSHSHQISESAGRMLTGLLSLHGVTANMIRDPGWHMLGIGRSLERCLQLCQLLSGTTTVRRGIDVDRQVLNGVLSASESAVTHRRRYRGYVRPAGVLELLLSDADNPRSMRFALAEMRGHLAAMPASTGSTRPERLLEDLEAELDGIEIAALVAIGGVARPNLETFLADTTAQLTRLGAAISETHLASGPGPRPFGALSEVALSEVALSEVPSDAAPSEVGAE